MFKEKIMKNGQIDFYTFLSFLKDKNRLQQLSQYQLVHFLSLKK